MYNFAIDTPQPTSNIYQESLNQMSTAEPYGVYGGQQGLARPANQLPRGPRGDEIGYLAGAFDLNDEIDRGKHRSATQ